MIAVRVFGWLVLLGRSQASKDAVILVAAVAAMQFAASTVASGSLLLMGYRELF